MKINDRFFEKYHKRINEILMDDFVSFWEDVTFCATAEVTEGLF